MIATWNGQIIAKSDDTIIIEGNHYFPKGSISDNTCMPSSTHTSCPWKGVASYYSIMVNGETNYDAAWSYLVPISGASEIKEYVAFWKGVEVNQ